MIETVSFHDLVFDIMKIIEIVNTFISISMPSYPSKWNGSRLSNERRKPKLTARRYIHVKTEAENLTSCDTITLKLLFHCNVLSSALLTGKEKTVSPFHYFNPGKQIFWK